MSQDRKYLLIVDDTEIDRIILKSILCTEFEILEASSGNMAFEFITSKREILDAILLDISMPNIDGFDVMRFMEDKGINDIPVFLVTAEPTRANVEKALQYNVAEFIGKPFDKEDILRRLRSRLGVLPRYDLEKGDLTETLKNITDLEVFYRNYLANFGKNDAHYRIMTDLMEILLTNYNRLSRGSRLSEDNITLISKAAYFCDIGEMLIPDKRLQLLSGRTTSVQDLQRNHTEFGASLIRLSEEMSEAYRRGLTGKNRSVLLEEPFVFNHKQYYTGYTKEYVKVAVETSKDRSGCMVSGKITGPLTQDIYLLVEF